jgi:hypothetical protein
MLPFYVVSVYLVVILLRIVSPCLLRMHFICGFLASCVPLLLSVALILSLCALIDAYVVLNAITCGYQICVMVILFVFNAFRPCFSPFFRPTRDTQQSNRFDADFDSFARVPHLMSCSCCMNWLRRITALPFFVLI